MWSAREILSRFMATEQRHLNTERVKCWLLSTLQGSGWRYMAEDTCKLLVFTGVPEEPHAVSWRSPSLRLPALFLAYFPVGGTTPGGKRHPRIWSLSIIALKWLLGGTSWGEQGGMAGLCSVSGGPRSRRGGANPEDSRSLSGWKRRRQMWQH